MYPKAPMEPAQRKFPVLNVDGSSMTRLLGKEFAIRRVHDFGTNDRVHHTNYFAQPETATFMTKTLLPIPKKTHCKPNLWAIQPEKLDAVDPTQKANRK